LVTHFILSALLILPAGSAGADDPAAAPAPKLELSRAPDRIVRGLYLDTPVSDDTVDRSVRILNGLRRRYGLHGGVRDDEEAARRALAEIESLEFSQEDRQRMAETLGLSLDPARCGVACGNHERLVLLKLKMQALERLASDADASRRMGIQRAPTGPGEIDGNQVLEMIVEE
jgi:hypothetical protein